MAKGTTNFQAASISIRCRQARTPKKMAKITSAAAHRQNAKANGGISAPAVDLPTIELPAQTNSASTRNRYPMNKRLLAAASVNEEGDVVEVK